jgi:hypothetical protein
MMNITIPVSWNISCRLVKKYYHLGGYYCYHHQGRRWNQQVHQKYLWTRLCIPEEYNFKSRMMRWVRKNKTFKPRVRRRPSEGLGIKWKFNIDMDKKLGWFKLNEASLIIALLRNTAERVLFSIMPIWRWKYSHFLKYNDFNKLRQWAKSQI